MTQFLVELRLGGLTRVRDFFFLRKTRPAFQIEVLVMFPADGRGLGERDAQILLVLHSYVLLCTPLVTAVSKLRSLGLGPSEG